MPNTCKSNGNRPSGAGEWWTGEECVGICPVAGDNLGKLKLIPHTPYGGKQGIFGPCTIG